MSRLAATIKAIFAISEICVEESKSHISSENAIKAIRELLRQTQAYTELRKMYEELTYYRNLDKQGRLIELPCKVGDELFVHHRTFKGEIVKGVCIGYTWWRTDGFCIMFHSDTPNYGKVDIAFSDFGKTIFLTKEEAEAEAKLAELKGE